MLFFADENIPAPAITYLRDHAFDIIGISESTDTKGLSDTNILATVIKMDAILLTLDSDFGTLVFKNELSPPKGIVYFRDKGSDSLQIAKWIVHRIKNENLRLEGYFTVIEKSGTRQRKL